MPKKPMSKKEYLEWAKKHNAAARKYSVESYKRGIADSRMKLKKATALLMNSNLSQAERVLLETKIAYHKNHIRHLKQVIKQSGK